MVRKPNARLLAIAAGAAWACALPDNAAPPPAGTEGGSTSIGGTNPSGGSSTGGTEVGGSSMGGTGGSTTGGSTTGGSAGTVTGGSATGGSAGTMTGGSAGSMAGSAPGGAGGTAGAGGSMAGTTGAGVGGAMAGTGGSMAGTGGGGKGGMGSTLGLAHRYSFDGAGTVATDSVGNRNGSLENGATQSGGAVSLAGGTSDQYVQLPAGIVSALSNATIEAWVTWSGGTSNWQRVFDFGANDGGSGDQGTQNASSPYFFFTPRATATSASGACTNTTADMPRVAFTESGPANESCVFDGTAFPTSMTHLAVTVSGSTLSLYIGGSPAGTPTSVAPLSALSDTNNWLGRSQFSADTEFAGSIHEFRIYNVARSATQIAASAAAGPDMLPAQ